VAEEATTGTDSITRVKLLYQVLPRPPRPALAGVSVKCLPVAIPALLSLLLPEGPVGAVPSGAGHPPPPREAPPRASAKPLQSLQPGRRGGGLFAAVGGGTGEGGFQDPEGRGENSCL